MLNWFLARLKEPSTYAGIAGLAIAAGLSADKAQAIASLVAALAGLAAVVLAERKPDA